MMNLWSQQVGGAVLALLFTGSCFAQGGGRPALVSTDAVTRAPLVQTVEVIGRLVSRQSGVVAAQVAGPVTRMHVDTGDSVAAGDVIAEINIDAMRARQALAQSRLDQSRTLVSTREAEIKLARLSRERYQKLTRSQTITRAAYDDAVQAEIIATSRLAEAKAGVGLAEADLHLAEVDLKRNLVKAPYPGIVVRRSTEIGSYVRLGEAVVELIGSGNLEIELDVPFDRLGGVSPGVQMQVRLDDGSLHTASVRAMVPVEDPRTRTRVVRLKPEIAGSERALAVGQTATVMVPVGSPRDILAVHKDAVIRRGATALVYVVVDGEAAAKTVRLGDAIGERFEVLDGLAVGDQAVIRGNERLRPGAKVTTGGGKPGEKSRPKPDTGAGKESGKTAE